jgi:tRNA 2-selenouridine synthase
MSIAKLSIDEFLEFAKTNSVLDVRSPAEFNHAHIPGAYSVPIFSNEERKIIGTAYKQESREKAIKLGLEFFGKTMVHSVEKVEKLLAARSSKEVCVHCWRGGMRSAAMAWLLDLYGFKVFVLSGGYKSYRRWALRQFEKDYQLRIVGGCTGGNKTGILHELKKQNEPVIDLEGIANHKGSAFGNLDGSPQPSQEHFENILALELFLNSGNQNKIWLEAESQRLGLINIPFSFHQAMRSQPLFFMDIPFQERLTHILKDYGHYDKEKLINAIIRIKKKLGGLETKNAINALLEDDTAACFSILLHYYDKLYLKSTSATKEEERKIISIQSSTTDPKINSNTLLSHVRSN